MVEAGSLALDTVLQRKYSINVHLKGYDQNHVCVGSKPKENVFNIITDNQ